MASNSKKTEMRRKRKTRAAGKERKRKARRVATPPFPIHAEKATEK